MDSAPLFSVIIPIYNSGLFLNKSVNSVLQQSCDDFELILVDDGSTDNSVEIIEDIQKKYPRKVIICKKENGGASSARNFGMHQAHGRYIVFIDSDDMIDPGYLECFRKAILQHNSPPIVIAGFMVVDVNGISTEIISAKEAVITKSTGNLVEEVPLLCLSSPIAKVFQKSIVTDNNIVFNESINIGEDLVFVMDMLCKLEKIISIPKALYQYDKRMGSLSTSYNSVEEELNAENLIVESTVRTMKMYSYKDDAINSFIVQSYRKHAYRILFALYNKGKFKYSFHDRVKIIESIPQEQFQRLKAYLESNSVKGRLISMALNKSIFRISDKLISFIFKYKKA